MDNIFRCFFILLIVTEIVCQIRPAYHGLLPAQVAHYELVGIDLYLDTLLQFAAWCIGIALALPMFKLFV